MIKIIAIFSHTGGGNNFFLVALADFCC